MAGARSNHQPIGGSDPNHQEPTQGCHERCVRVCLLLKDLVQSCLLGEGGILEDMCYEIRRAEACVDLSDHHTLVKAGEIDRNG